MNLALNDLLVNLGQMNSAIAASQTKYYSVNSNESGSVAPLIPEGFEQYGNVVKLWTNAKEVSPFAQFA